jgi:hypothetical protein
MSMCICACYVHVHLCVDVMCICAFVPVHLCVDVSGVKWSSFVCACVSVCVCVLCIYLWQIHSQHVLTGIVCASVVKARSPWHWQGHVVYRMCSLRMNSLCKSKKSILNIYLHVYHSILIIYLRVYYAQNLLTSIVCASVVKLRRRVEEVQRGLWDRTDLCEYFPCSWICSKSRAGEGQQTERVPQFSVLPAAQVPFLFLLVSPARVVSACIHTRGVAHNSRRASDRLSNFSLFCFANTS